MRITQGEIGAEAVTDPALPVTEVSFCGLRLRAAPGKVMTPRLTTEALVEAAVGRIGSAEAVVADVGTGSGAIAIAIAAQAPTATIWATDTSSDAVALARENVIRHGLCSRVRVVRGDLLEPVTGPLDLVVANLPYLPLSRLGDPTLLDDPPAALFTGGDGLGPYRRLVAACSARLRPDGALLFQLHRTVHAVPAEALGGVELAA